MPTIVLLGGKILGAGGYVFNVGTGGTPTACATPVLTPAGGSFSVLPTSVALSCSTGGSTIYYTTDGTTPTTGSAVYSTPITPISSGEQIQAIATAPGYTTSATASGTYTLATQAATPVFSPVAGPYTTAQSVTITCATAGNTIYYTTDGTTPTTSSTQYMTPVSISTLNAQTVLQAIAIATGYSQSNTASGTYTIGETVATPTFSPASGSYTTSQSVTIASAATPTGATIKYYYTTNGTTPTTSSTLYTGPVAVNATTTLNAIATATGYLTSAATGNETYTIATNPGRSVLFNYSTGIPSNAPINAGGNTYSSIANGVLTIPNENGHHSGCAYYFNVHAENPFTTVFTFSPSYAQTVINQNSGMSFCIQNTTAPPSTAGFSGQYFFCDANGCGYIESGQNGTFPQSCNSLAIKFDTAYFEGQYYPSGGTPSSTGLALNGGAQMAENGGGSGVAWLPQNDLNPSGINFYNNTHVYQVTIVYDGSVLVMVLKDTNTNAQARYEWPLNIANVVTNSAANGSYVGFTAGHANGNADLADLAWNILGWEWWTGYNTRLATPTFNPPAGEYSGTQTVTISHPTGSTCYYTLNGLPATTSSTVYSGALTVASNTLINAVAVQSGYTDSYSSSSQYRIGTANYINFGSGFSAGNLITCGFAYLNGSGYNLTDGTTQQAVAALWYPGQVPISSFSTTFKVTLGTGGQGFGFVIQNNPAAYTSPSSTKIAWSGGPTVLGVDNNAIGYGGINANSGFADNALGLMQSVGLMFAINGFESNAANSVGVYTNGAKPYGSNTATGLTFAGNSFICTVGFSGTTLNLTMQQVGGSTYTKPDGWSVNVPSIVEGSSAYVGFVGSNGGGNKGAIEITSWTM